MTLLRFSALLCLAFLFSPHTAAAATLAQSLSGRILLQVEAHGEAWYVDPVTEKRFYLGRAEDAYTLMRTKGLGIRQSDLVRFQATRFPQRLSGRILLAVESHGEAYYIMPQTLQAVYLGHAADAYNLMRRYGLGITNANLALIPTGNSVVSLPIPQPAPAPYQSLERDAFNRINTYRSEKGLSALRWNEEIATIARQHSVEMANGRVAFGHGGFNDRAKLLQQKLTLHGVAENVAYNDYPDPALTAVTGWIASDGHRINIENTAYSLSGMGVARSSDGAYYFTQLFIAP